MAMDNTAEGPSWWNESSPSMGTLAEEDFMEEVFEGLTDEDDIVDKDVEVEFEEESLLGGDESYECEFEDDYEWNSMLGGIESANIDVEGESEQNSVLSGDENVDIVDEDGCEEMSMSRFDESFDIDVDNECEQNSFIQGEDVQIRKLVIISSVDDILGLNLKNLTCEEVKAIKFVSLEMAYEFYYWFARFNGFAVRKSKVLTNCKGERTQQTFLCYREGYRQARGLTVENRRRDMKMETRCGCHAKLRVHINIVTGLWYITEFVDVHSHLLLEDMQCRMLASHRSMTDVDVMQVDNLRAVGVGTPHIYAALANQAGGYDRLNYRKKDIYNQIGRQRKLKNVDAKSALKYLRDLGKNDPLMFFRHTVDEDNRLQHLFWSDGIMQMDYHVFGDVLAFDATYGKNKYECPIVIFSGVNHHNHTVVFAAAVVSNEKEETYVWILERFLEAMKGKSPVSVITDGDIAIKNSIKRVFPDAYHRLCAWHLSRNATANISNPQFTRQFERCMLGDLEVGEFKKKWGELVSKFHVEHNSWVLDLYEKRRMWCTAYFRGSFFAGFRTTSRCEALHSQIAKFVYSRHNLTELLKHFQRCLNFMRHREDEADFDSMHGDIPLRTHYQKLEKSARDVFTKEIFNLFRPLLDKSGMMRVVGCKESFDYLIYTISKCERSERVWHVSFQPSTNYVKCSCRRMESLGLPCDHILRLLVYLNVPKLPDCLILKRWTKQAKVHVHDVRNYNNYWGSEKDVRYLSLMEHFKNVSVLAAETFDDYNDQREKAIEEWKKLVAKKDRQTECSRHPSDAMNNNVNDPARVRTKGGRVHTNMASGGGRQSKIVKKCSKCRQPGHNKRNCPTNANDSVIAESMTYPCFTPEQFPVDSIGVVNNDMEYVDDESVAGVDSEYHETSAYDSVDDHTTEPYLGPDI